MENLLMSTVIFYNLNLLVSTFFVWLSEKAHTRAGRWVLLAFAFFIVFIPAAIRYDIGTDYLSYVDIFYDSSQLEKYRNTEPAFYFINWFLNSIGLSAQWAIAAFALIFTLTTFKSYPKRNAWIFHFLFFSILWFFSFTGIRQSVSISFCTLSLFYYFDRKYLCFLFLSILGYLFHNSSLIIPIIGFISFLPIPQYFKTSFLPKLFIALILSSFFMVGIISNYLETILGALGLEKYTHYFNGRFYRQVTSGTGSAALTKIGISIYIISNSKDILHKNKNYWIVILTVFLYAVSVVLAMNILIFGRLTTALVFIIPIALFIINKVKRNRKIHQILISLFLIFFLMVFIKESLGLKSSTNDPKINPYQTIIEADIK